MGLFNSVKAYEEESTEVNINIEPGSGDADILEETKTDVLVDDIVETVEELEADGVEVSNAADAMDQLEDKNEQITEILASDPSAVTEPVANMAIESVAMILTSLGGGRTADAITRNTGLVISQESYQSAYDRLVITNESISGTIRNIIQKIKVIFEKIKAYISKLISKVKIGFVRLTGRLDKLKTRLSKVNKSNAKVEIPSTDGRRVARKILGQSIVYGGGDNVLDTANIELMLNEYKNNDLDKELTTLSSEILKKIAQISSGSIADLKAAKGMDGDKDVINIVFGNEQYFDEKPEKSAGPALFIVADGFYFKVLHTGEIKDGSVNEMPSFVRYKLSEKLFNGIKVNSADRSTILTMISGLQTITRNFDKYIKNVSEKITTPIYNALGRLSKINVDDLDGREESDALEKVRYFTKLMNLFGTTLATSLISGRASVILGLIDYVSVNVEAFEAMGKNKETK